jgi:replicative DNA helicase
MDVNIKTAKRRINGLINNTVKLYGNPNAESALLAMCCHEEHASDAYTSALKAGITLEDFGIDYEMHRLVWLALGDLHKTNRPISPATLSSSIKKRLGATPTNIDVDISLNALLERPINPDDLEVYAREVREAGVRRTAQLEALELVHSVGVLDPATISTRMNAIGERTLLDNEHGTSAAGMFDAMKNHLNTQFVRVMAGTASGMKTPIEGLNEVLDGGCEPGCIHYWGGPPGAGKTRLVTFLTADEMLKHSAIVDWYSVETTNTKTMAMFVAATEALQSTSKRRNTLTVSNLFKLKISNDDIREAGGDKLSAQSALAQRITTALARAREWPGELLHTMVGPDFTAQHIYAQVRSRMMLRAASGDKRPYVVVVDYAQGLRSGERGLSGTEEIQRACERLRYMCKGLNITVHVIYHTSRTNPNQAHGSSQVEKDADFAAVLTREEGNTDTVTLQPTKTRDATPKAVEMGVDYERCYFFTKGH